VALLRFSSDRNSLVAAALCRAHHAIDSARWTPRSRWGVMLGNVARANRTIAFTFKGTRCGSDSPKLKHIVQLRGPEEGVAYQKVPCKSTSVGASDEPRRVWGQMADATIAAWSPWCRPVKTLFVKRVH
jgi:hypothetical protein